MKTLDRVDRRDTFYTRGYRGGYIHGHTEYKTDHTGRILDSVEVIKVATGEGPATRVESIHAAQKRIREAEQSKI